MADIIGSLINGVFGLGGTALSYDEQKKLAEQQNQYNIDMWKMNNEYNSPQAQMNRFRKAGLNPNLIYGQGTAGNSSAPPQQVTAQAPDWSKGMQKLAEAFNIEGLRTTRAQRQIAEADAKLHRVNANMAADEYEGLSNLGAHMYYDPVSGRYGFDTPYKQYINNGEMKPYAFYRAMNALSDNYQRMYLLPYRANLLDTQNRYMQPQISMANYDERFYPYAYWIDKGGRAIHAVSDVVGMVNPLRMAFKPLNYSYRSPYRR